MGARKGGCLKGWVPEGWGPKGWGAQTLQKWEHPKDGGPEAQISPFFFALWGLLVELWPGFKAVDHPNSAFGLPGVIV